MSLKGIDYENKVSKPANDQLGITNYELGAKQPVSGLTGDRFDTRGCGEEGRRMGRSIRGRRMRRSYSKIGTHPTRR